MLGQLGIVKCLNKFNIYVNEFYSYHNHKKNSKIEINIISSTLFSDLSPSDLEKWRENNIYCNIMINNDIKTSKRTGMYIYNIQMFLIIMITLFASDLFEGTADLVGSDNNPLLGKFVWTSPNPNNPDHPSHSIYTYDITLIALMTLITLMTTLYIQVAKRKVIVISIKT